MIYSMGLCRKARLGFRFELVKGVTMILKIDCLKSPIIAAAILILGSGSAGAVLDLDLPITVQDSGVDLTVLGYSVPTCADWDGDGWQDLIVGEGGGGHTVGSVKIYRNVGTAESPAFSGFVYAESGGQPLTCPASGCQGVFPRVVNWDHDGRKDLLIGQADGTIRIYLNVGTDTEPQFDGGAYVQAGSLPATDIDIGFRATPIWVDWNRDGRDDLLCGAGDGRVQLFLDTAVSGEPQLAAAVMLQQGGADLVVPGARSSPDYADFDGDGRRDLLVGNTYGMLLLYENLGTDSAPIFAAVSQVLAGGVPIDLPGDPRSRPFVTDWTNRGHLDVLVGSADGMVHVYGGPADVSPVPLPQVAVPMVAYPNPFNPMVNIKFVLAESRNVELEIFSLAGRRVARLAQGQLAVGPQSFTWNGRDHLGNNVPSGQYIVHLSGTATDEKQKITLLR